MVISDDDFRRLYFQKFKYPKSQKSSVFLSGVDPSVHVKWMEEDLRRSGLTPEMMMSSVDATARPHEDSQAQYTIAYFDPHGAQLDSMWRVRYKRPEYSKFPRYLQPSTDSLTKAGLPPNVPYIHPMLHQLEGENLLCCEGEKKTVSVMRHLALPAFGIGGCQMWRNPADKNTLHPWIVDLLKTRGTKTLAIVPDGDLYKYDICGAYGAFAHAVEAIGISVTILVPPGKIDDLLVGGLVSLDEIPTVGSEGLVRPLSSLIDEYKLAYRTDGKGNKIAEQHTANVQRILEDHPAFPKIWRNKDTNQVVIGDDAAIPDVSEMLIANHLQYYLGFTKVTHRFVAPLITAQAEVNGRSPFLEYVKSIKWDGVSRLESWMIRHWGCEDTPFVREVSLKWLVGACARLDNPGVKIDWIFIVIGPQGIGKTSMPGILFKEHYNTIIGEHNDKDFYLGLHSHLCVGLDELDSFGKRDQDFLKALITKTTDSFRPPYGSGVKSFPRRFTLYGCGNAAQFLQDDPSGYRRYPIIAAPRKLDFAGLLADRDQMWAEAWQRYLDDGLMYWEVENASQNAMQYVIENPKREAILGWVEKMVKDKPPNLWWEDKMAYPDRKFNLVFTLGLCMQVALGVEPSRGNNMLNKEVGNILASLYGPPKLFRGPMGTARYYTVK